MNLLMKKLTEGGVCPGAIYMHMTTIFKDLLLEKTAWPIKAKLYVEPPREGEKKDYVNGPGHITKIATMPIDSKNLFLQN